MRGWNALIKGKAIGNDVYSYKDIYRQMAKRAEDITWCVRLHKMHFNLGSPLMGWNPGRVHLQVRNKGANGLMTIKNSKIKLRESKV